MCHAIRVELTETMNNKTLKKAYSHTPPRGGLAKLSVKATAPHDVQSFKVSHKLRLRTMMGKKIAPIDGPRHFVNTQLFPALALLHPQLPNAQVLHLARSLSLNNASGCRLWRPPMKVNWCKSAG